MLGKGQLPKGRPCSISFQVVPPCLGQSNSFKVVSDSSNLLQVVIAHSNRFLILLGTIFLDSSFTSFWTTLPYFLILDKYY